MRITIEEVLACPKGMSVEEYHLLLEKQEKRNQRLRRLSQERDFLEDGLAILSDEREINYETKKVKVWQGRINENGDFELTHQVEWG